MRGWRGFLGWLALTTTVGMLNVASVVAGETRPNVVVVLADDAGWGDYGHSGNRQSRTPRIVECVFLGVQVTCLSANANSIADAAWRELSRTR